MFKQTCSWFILALTLISALGMVGIPPVQAGSNYTAGATAKDSTSVQFWFKTNGWTANYVIVHYRSPALRNKCNLVYNSSTGQGNIQ